MTTARISECPTWEKFILDSMGGDPQSVEDLRMALKDGLNGSADKRIAVLFGPSASGKTTFLRAARRAVGERISWADGVSFADPYLAGLVGFGGMFLATNDYREDLIDDSVIRRLRVFRFYPPIGRPDIRLSEKLADEAGGILGWIEG